MTVINIHSEPRPSFDDFWALYPRRVARKHAAKMWSRLSDEDAWKALDAIKEWRKVWADKDPEYIPHAGSWLNGERWTDELPKTNGNGQRKFDPVAYNAKCLAESMGDKAPRSVASNVWNALPDPIPRRSGDR